MTNHRSPIIPESLCIAVPSDEALRALPEAEKQTWITPGTLENQALVHAMHRERDARYRPMVLDLMRAGWTPEIPDHGDDMMSWAWRRQPRRRNSLGMRFASTDQAWNALEREKCRVRP